MKQARHRNGGLRKRCTCYRKNWPKCPHPWHFSYQHREIHYRFSLDQYLGRHIDSKTDAETAAERLRVAIKEGKFQWNALTPLTEPANDSIPESTVETFKDYACDWLRTATLNLKASTVRFYTDHLENHLLPLLGSRQINAITRKDCRQLVTAARERGLRVATVSGIARTLSTILSQAVEDDYLSANPAFGMRKHLRRADEPEPEINPFTRSEAAHLVEIAREHVPEWYSWTLCGLRTGMRLGELLALQWGDFDWHKGFVHVQRNLVRGKLTTPKNHQRRRVDLSPQLRVALRLWRRQQSAMWLKLGLPRPDWVFPSSAGTPLDESNVRKAFNQILDRAELHRRGPHQMRHTFASLLLQAGEPITYVSAQLGHRDSAITLRVYAHWLPDTTSRKGVERLDDASEKVAQQLHTASESALRRPA